MLPNLCWMVSDRSDFVLFISNRTLHGNGSRPVELLGIMVAIDGMLLLLVLPFASVVDV